MDNSKVILDAFHRAEVLARFKDFCDLFEDNPERQNKIRNILYRSRDKSNTISGIFKNNLQIDLKEDDLSYMLELVEAFLNKNNYRVKIEQGERVKLAQMQNGLCPFCGCNINENDPVDHIVPFKYVGDELKDNYQILCKSCNSSKNADIGYQIKVLLRG